MVWFGRPGAEGRRSYHGPTDKKTSINLDHDNSFFKERSCRDGMTVVSVLLGAAVEVGVGSNPSIAK